MKIKVLITISILVIVLVFTGNWIYGNISAKKLDVHLQQLSESARPLYSDIKVNPLCSKIIFKNFSIPYPNSTYKIESDVLCVNIKHREAMEIAKTQKVDKLTGLSLDFKNIKLSGDGMPTFVSEELLFDFEGDMSQVKLAKLEEQFPEQKQMISVEIKEGDWIKPKLKNTNFVDLPIELPEIEYAYIVLLFNHANKTMELEKIRLETAGLEFEGETELSYFGEGLNDISISQINMEYNCVLSDSLSWGDSNSSGRYTVQSFSSALEGYMELNENGELQPALSQLSFNLDLKDIKVEYQGAARMNMEAQLSMLGISPQDLWVDEISLNAKIGDGRCVVKNTKLRLPLLEATLDANIKLLGDGIDSTDIENMELRLSNIDSDFKMHMKNIERAFGLKIPSEGEDIVLQITGSLKNPKIKGIHY
ncbi:hypothetical protein [Saccharicrinis carchari]|nr:hypothetical protein [Saccharicrinis carchari]